MQNPPSPFPPSPLPASPAERAAAQAQSLIGTLRTAAALVAARREIDLAGLDDTVGRLCAAFLDLPRDEGLALRSLLAELLAELDHLTTAVADAEPDAEPGAKRSAEPPETAP